VGRVLESDNISRVLRGTPRSLRGPDWPPAASLPRHMLFHGRCYMLVWTLLSDLAGSHAEIRIKFVPRVCGSFRPIFRSIGIEPDPRLCKMNAPSHVHDVKVYVLTVGGHSFLAGGE